MYERAVPFPRVNVVVGMQSNYHQAASVYQTPSSAQASSFDPQCHRLLDYNNFYFSSAAAQVPQCANFVHPSSQFGHQDVFGGQSMVSLAASTCDYLDAPSFKPQPEVFAWMRDSRKDRSKTKKTAPPRKPETATADRSSCSSTPVFVSRRSDETLNDPQRPRMAYSTPQVVELEKEFRTHRYLNRPQRADLAKVLGLSDRQVKIWFQNRRMKEKKRERELLKGKGGGDTNVVGPNGLPHAAHSDVCREDVVHVQATVNDHLWNERVSADVKPTIALPSAPTRTPMTSSGSSAAPLRGGFAMSSSLERLQRCIDVNFPDVEQDGEVSSSRPAIDCSINYPDE